MTLSLGELTESIRQSIDSDMEFTVAEGMAEHALGFFGYSDRIIDNALEPTDRNLFYMFQDYELLTTESEETTLWDGREWRIHYWKFKEGLREKMLALLSSKDTVKQDDSYLDVHGHMAERIWRHGEEEYVKSGVFTANVDNR